MLVVERVRDEQRAHDAADDVRPMDAGPEEDALQADDDRAARERVRKALQRRLDDLEDELRQRRRADIVAEAVEHGRRREEHHARHERGERARHALRHGVRHLDADVVLLEVAEHARDEERDQDGGDDAVAARPSLRDDVADDGALLRRDGRRHQDQECREREDGRHHRVTAFILHILIGDG